MQSPSLTLLPVFVKGESEYSQSISLIFGLQELRFGFIKYHNYNDAENCIRGFYYRKYEAKFARVRCCFPLLGPLQTDESQVGHNERLKTLANPNNTNLYLSNLPKNMNEAVSDSGTGLFS